MNQLKCSYQPQNRNSTGFIYKKPHKYVLNVNTKTKFAYNKKSFMIKSLKLKIKILINKENRF